MGTTTELAATSSAGILEELQALYNQGFYLQAYHLGQTLGPLKDWQGPTARILAARLAVNLGATRLNFWLLDRAWRETPEDPEVCYFYALGLLERRGLLPTWKFLRTHGDLPEAPDGVRADWWALHARLAGRFRDFDAAEAWLDRAAQVCPDRPWSYIERSFLFELQDRCEDALAAGQQSLALRPWYRPGVQCVSHVLQLLGREDEALELLAEADRRLECALVTLPLAMLQTERGYHGDARRSLERYVELSPLLEPDLVRWVAARRCEAAYLDGDLTAAATLAREVKDDPHYAQFAERLSRTPVEGRRVVLPVGFIRQHHQTCVPATLAAITRFWSMPAEHLEIAAAITYNGTPAHSERRWAEEHGWAVREFTVTRESAMALLDRGVPFTLTIVEPTFAHLQAGIGYDSIQDMLLVRDPSLPHYGQYPADGFLKRYQAVGPRGMALVPADRADLLADLVLPDAGMYDRLYELQGALQRHDRESARQIYEAVYATEPNHYLTWHARRALAAYDADPAELLAVAEGLLQLFPDDEPLKVGKFAYLRDLAGRNERLEYLKAQCHRPGADAVFQLQYAQELSTDARQDYLTQRALRRVLRFQPANALAYNTLANVRWAQRRFDEALQLYRWAACLDDKNELLVQAYFRAARAQRQTGTALAFLKDRFQRFGALSSLPARTLYWAYSQLEELPEAFEVLDSAMQLRPEDGDLLRFAAEARANRGDTEQAAQLLAGAEGRSQRTFWLRTAAHLALLRGEHENALGMWRQVATVEPLALDAHREITLLLAETGRQPEALDYLRQVCERFPHHYGLHQLQIDWLRREGVGAAEPAIRQVMAIHPADAWSRRELALNLADQGRLDEAFPELEVAEHLDPSSPWNFTTRARLCLLTGRLEEAREAFRQAIRLSVDCVYALQGLVDACDTLAQRREAIAFVESELERQVILGEALSAFRQVARATLQPAEVLSLLRAGHAARPDLWQAWSALIGQLTETNQLDEALALAQQATARFPLLPALWLDLGLVHQMRRDFEGEIEAIRHALQINRSWGAASRQLATAYKRAGRLEEARTTLEVASQLTPLDYQNYGYLADVLWLLGEKEAALERIRQALRLEPGFSWGWGALSDWSARLGRPEVAVAQARELTLHRPEEARSWLMLARMLTRPEERDESVAAVDRALALNPRLVEAHDLKASLLAGARKFDEALAACTALAWEGRPPLLLRGRAAWLQARRGQVQEAIAQMRTVLAEDPAYEWGWTQLAEWYRDTRQHDGYLEAADRLVQLNPRDWLPFGYQGEARLRKGDRAGAKQALRQAMELSPGYTFAGYTLFDLELADNELEEADRTLALLQKHAPSAFTSMRAVELAARRGEQDQALAVLKALCVNAEKAGVPVEEATKAVVQAGWFRQAEEVFTAALDEPNVVPAVGALWVQRCTARGEWRCEQRLPALLEKGEVGRSALTNYLQALGQSMKADLVKPCLKRYRDYLQSDTRGWGMAGYALTNAGYFREAADWLKDHADREKVEPWMVLNLAISLRAIGNDAEAAAVSRRALTLPPDGTTPYHRLWLAADDLVAGAAIDDAVLDAMNPAAFDHTHRFLYNLVECLSDLRQAPPAQRGRTFQEVRRRLREAAANSTPLVQDRPAVLRIYRQSIRRIARDAGGLQAKLWGLGRRLWPLLPKPVASTRPAPKNKS